MLSARCCRRGFTLIEGVLVILLAGVLVAILLPALGKKCVGTRQMKDSANIRGIHQGLVLFAQNNNERYPLPSILDKSDKTIALKPGEPPESKDTTSNIIATLISGTFFGPEICISPAESNGGITLDTGYEYEHPSTAVDPKLALWDPAFNADFSSPGSPTRPGGHFSYAHMLPTGSRLAQWSNTFIATQAVIGNRGPLISSVEHGRSGNTITSDPKSLTLLIHGSLTAWEGNIAYNDNHVAFESRMDPDTCPRTDTAGRTWLDTLFFDEPDDAPDKNGPNNFLVNINKAGPTPADFHFIWD